MSENNLLTPSRRIRKAYSTAAVVMLSYAWLLFLKKIRGQKYYEKRIYRLHVKNAERVKNAILELKGLFIKIGQMLSILGNFLPEEFQKPLEELQDKIPPRPFAEVAERIQREFGKTPSEIFTDFEETPLASASIGQAHRAALPDGTKVVVKVQHAHIEEIAKVDLEIIRKLTQLISWFFDIKGMDFMYSQVRKMIEEELDFGAEAKAMQLIRENLLDEERFEIPAVHPAFSTNRVLTTTWHEGVKITNLKQLDEWKIDRRDLAARLLRVYCRMVFKDGFYHADPHPGNILVKENGTLVLLDFGAVSPLSKQLREGIPQLIEAAIKNDTDAMIDACRAMGFFAEGREAEEMAEKMLNAMQNFLQNEVQIEGLNFKEIKVNPFNNSLLDLIQDIGLSGISGTVQVPKDWILLNRMITLLLGICSMLDSSMNPLDVVRPYAKEFVLGEQENLVAFVTGLLRRTVTTSLGLPAELQTVLQKMKRGRLEIQTPDIREGAKLLYQAGQQFMFTLIIITCGVFGFLFYQNKEMVAAKWAFGVAGVFMFLLLRSIRRGGKIRRRLGN